MKYFFKTIIFIIFINSILFAESFDEYTTLETASKEMKKIHEDEYFRVRQSQDTPLQIQFPFPSIIKEKLLEMQSIGAKEEQYYGIYILFALLVFILSFYWFTRDKKDNQESYDEAVDDFIHKYYYSATVIKDMMKFHEYEDVKDLIIDITKSALVLGAGKLIDSGRNFEGYFNDKSLDKASIQMDDFFEALEEVLVVMQRYRGM